MNIHHDEKNKIGIWVALSIVVGTIIGSGVFMKPGYVLGYAGNSTTAILAWIVGGIITIASGLTIAEIGAKIPKNGGLYTYLEEIYGGVWGYLSGWMQTVLYGPAIIGTLGLYFGSLLVNFFSIPTKWAVPIGIFAVLFLALINALGTKYGGFIQTLTTIGKLIPILFIVVFGFWKGNVHIWNNMIPETSSVHHSFGMAILTTLFAYDGWIVLASIGGEMKNPAKLLPKALAIGLTIVAIAYVTINMALLHILPANTIVKLGENATSTAAQQLLGNVGGKLISIGIIVSIFGCLNGKILTFPRITLSMAERKQLPFSTFISRVHKRFGTPLNAIIAEIIITLLFMIFSDPNKLSEIAVFIIYIFYVFALIGVFILRKRDKEKQRAYSVPLYPVVPIIAVLGSLFVIISTIINDVKSCLFSIILVLIGLPLYFYLQRKKVKKTSTY